jgi:hypothetical protein
MEATQTEDRQRDDPDAGGYAPPGVEAFCDLFRQQLQDRFCQGHRFRVGDGARIDQKSFVGADEKIDKICFQVGAWTLTQDKRLRFVLMDLKGFLRRCSAI